MKCPRGMLRSGLLACMVFSPILLFPCLPLFAQQPDAPPTPPAIHVEVNRVSVGAIVTDSGGKFIEGLQRENFHLLDDGVEQIIKDFAAVDEPANVLVLIEAGPAVYLMEGGHLSAIYGLLLGLSASDRVAVVRYAQTPLAIADFTADKRVTADAIQRLQFNLGFGELNLSSSLDTVFDWIENTPSKKSIVLLSTGLDTSAPDDATRLLQRLRVGDIRIFAVSLAGEMRTPAASTGKKKKGPPTNAENAAARQFAAADAVLKRLAEASGGSSYFPTNAREFAEAYAEIARDIRHEYNLGFVPVHDDGQVHTLDVRVTPGTANSAGTSPVPDNNANALRIYHRQAYVAPKAEAP
jgi:Ca-activated chloride channel family protein